MNYRFLKAFHALTDQALVDLCFRMAEAHPDTFTKLLGVDMAEFIIPGPYGGKVIFNPEQLAHIRMLAGGGSANKVVLIKYLRELTGIGLKEAKDLCEAEWIK